MFQDADSLNTGTITYEALTKQLDKHGGLLENLTISIDRWLVPLPKAAKKGMKEQMPHQLSVSYMKNNYVFVIFLAIYLLVNLGLFISRGIQYRKSNGFTIIARACGKWFLGFYPVWIVTFISFIGQCLNFTCAFVLVLMLRHSITYLRTRGFSTFLPLDQHIYLHKLTGIMIGGYSLVHTIMHLFNFSKFFRYNE